MKEKIRAILERWFMANDARMDEALEDLYNLYQEINNDNAEKK